MKKIRVLIIEDSGVIREFLKHIISRDPRLEVAAAVETAEEAFALLPKLDVDVISMDIRLPGMNGFDATKHIMTHYPTPVVVVSASVQDEDLKISMNALRAGAMAIMEKPVGVTHQDYEIMAERLCTQLAIMSQVKVIRQRTYGLANDATRVEPRSSSPRLPDIGEREFKFLAIVASTGGPRALLTILSDLPTNIPVPIAIVQHISSTFFHGFVSWLQDNCALPVLVPESGDLPAAGKVYVAPPDRHLTIARGRFHLLAGDPVCAQLPAGTVLFQSIAAEYGRSGLGVLLTGMGEDGAAGLLEMYNAGAYTIAEDESTAVVYGMPGVAVSIGAATEIIPLHYVQQRVLDLLNVNKEMVK